MEEEKKEPTEEKEKVEENTEEKKEEIQNQKPECKFCLRKFGSEEGLRQHMSAKHSEKKEEEKAIIKPVAKKKIRNWIIFLAILGLVFYGFYSADSAKNLPPSDQSNHIEQNPPSHILKAPMQLKVQRHMLEHADGSGPPGVIINYDCKNYECESDLIQKLESFATKYTEFVYVAPFKNMATKIALTRQGSIETLDEYDEEKIDNFINRRI